MIAIGLNLQWSSVPLPLIKFVGSHDAIDPSSLHSVRPLQWNNKPWLFTHFATSEPLNHLCGHLQELCFYFRSSLRICLDTSSQNVSKHHCHITPILWVHKWRFNQQCTNDLTYEWPYRQRNDKMNTMQQHLHNANAKISITTQKGSQNNCTHKNQCDHTDGSSHHPTHHGRSAGHREYIQHQHTKPLPTTITNILTRRCNTNNMHNNNKKMQKTTNNWTKSNNYKNKSMADGRRQHPVQHQPQQQPFVRHERSVLKERRRGAGAVLRMRRFVRLELVEVLVNVFFNGTPTEVRRPTPFGLRWLGHKSCIDDLLKTKPCMRISVCQNRTRMHIYIYIDIHVLSVHTYTSKYMYNACLLVRIQVYIYNIYI